MSNGHIPFATVKEQYLQSGIDVESALAQLQDYAISIHCWQGDDVGGFEPNRVSLGGGLAVTGSYPGKARTPDELRQDFAHALRSIPGTHRLNLHASYGEFDAPVERNMHELRHFQGWIDWAKDLELGLDFNPTFFSHPLADSGFTLAHADKGIRLYWVEHARACRDIGAGMGRQLGTPSIVNIWIPDGMKDTPADRLAPRQRLEQSLDAIFEKPISPTHAKDAIEAKLFGIGSESYVVGSHEFYLGYAAKKQTMLCLDAGHFHPTEVISDKVSSTLLFVPELLLHVSRGIRWDSDHIIVISDELLAIAQQIVLCDPDRKRLNIGLDFFDASVNRVAAWIVGTRAILQALLFALLMPHQALKAAEADGDFTTRLVLQEQAKVMPWGEVWREFCNRNETPGDASWLSDVKRYEKDVLSTRA